LRGIFFSIHLCQPDWLGTATAFDEMIPKNCCEIASEFVFFLYRKKEVDSGATVLMPA
jgi:hypothetical protein